MELWKCGLEEGRQNKQVENRSDEEVTTLWQVERKLLRKRSGDLVVMWNLSRDERILVSQKTNYTNDKGILHSYVCVLPFTTCLLYTSRCV